MKKIFSILVFSILSQISLHAQWERQNTPDYIIKDDFYSIAKVADSVFCAVGQGGRIIKSTDNGISWTSKPSPIVVETLYNIFFINQSKGWAAGENGRVVTTYDGGEKWSPVKTDISNELRGVFFINNSIGWICGSSGTIMKTTGGAWNPQVSNSIYTLHSIYFINADTGWICGDAGEILNTTDGGTVWNKQNSNTDYNLSSIFFLDSNNGWACGSLNDGQYGKILYTTDGGTNWDTQFNTQTDEGLYTIKFLDSNSGAAVGIGGTIYKTTNGGTDWIKKNSGTGYTLRSFSFNNLDEEITVGFNGTVLRSTNAGNNWLPVITEQDYNLKSVYFINKYLGWAAGSSGLIIRTTDGGSNWDRQYSGVSFDINKIYFIDSVNGFCAGNSGIILKTTNGGSSWYISFVNDAYPWDDLIVNFYAIAFTDLYHGWVGGEKRYGDPISNFDFLLYTTDGGVEWMPKSKPMTGYSILDIFFLDNNYGWRTSRNYQVHGSIFKTTNGGEDWTYITPDSIIKIEQYPPVDFRSVNFVNKDTGWAAGSYRPGYIFKTEDGGKSWSYTKNISWSLYDIEFPDYYHGWAVGNNREQKGIITNTIDGGETWDYLYFDYTLNAITFIDNKNGWAVGNDGVILKYKLNNSVWNSNINITEKSSYNSQILNFGQSPEATDGIDESLNEAELPPIPPSGVFDARFILPGNESSLTDIRNISQNQIIWTLKFQPASADHELTFTWNRSALPKGNFYLKDAAAGEIVNIDMKAQNNYTLTNTGISSLIIEFDKEICTDIQKNNGWNILSVPVEASDMTKSNLFPTAISSAFSYNNGYISAEDLEEGKGYWLKFSDSGDLQICGLPVNKNIQVKSGWNIIGTFDTDLSMSQITTTPSDLLSSNFFEYDGVYNTPTTLKKGKGYWVKAKQDGEINYGLEGAYYVNKQKITEEIKPMVELPINVDDRDGGKGIVVIGIDLSATDSLDSALGEEELPPLPPPGVFDARLNLPNSDLSSYKDIRYGPESDQFEKVYQVQYQREEGTEIVLSWDLPDGLTLRVQDIVTGNVIDQTFGAGIDSIVVTNPDAIDKLKLTVTYPSNYTPVELTSLKGEILNNAVELKWKTATETNNKGFEVERKLNSGWEKIGYIDGHGTTTIPSEYNYTDNFKYQSFKGIVSYRLKQIDLDGSYHYSEEIKLSIDFTPKEFILYQNYPNPFNPNTVIKYALPYESSVDIIIYNMIGQRVEEFKEGIKEAGYHNVNWQPKNLSSGVYFYSIVAKSTDGRNNYSKTLKMLYMK